MSGTCARQLFEQAEHLARRERKRPRQASLRRAVSAAYYGLFHFLVDQACRSHVGGTHQQKRIRQILTRGFQHGAMMEASKSFAAGTLPRWIDTIMPNLSIPRDLQVIADTFVTLQQERHRADYDLAGPFTREETLRLIGDARDVVGLWDGIKDHRENNFSVRRGEFS